MNARRLFALLLGCFAMLPLEARAVFFGVRPTLVERNRETVLTSPFGAEGPRIDVYHFVAKNPYPNPATSIELNLDGPFLNNFTFSQLDFQDNTSLPAPAGIPVAESFFVIPPGTVGVGRDDIDDENGVLSAAYTIQGGRPSLKGMVAPRFCPSSRCRPVSRSAELVGPDSLPLTEPWCRSTSLCRSRQLPLSC